MPADLDAVEVVKRLRAHRPYNSFADGPLVIDAATLIASLAEENARLRKVVGQNHDEANRYVNEMIDWKARALTAEDALAKAVAAVKEFASFGCPICNGDCGAANPPVYSCPMQSAAQVEQDAALRARTTGGTDEQG